MVKASQELRRRILERRLDGERQYSIARRARLHPSLVSHILNGSTPIQPNDARVLRLANALGVPAEQAFEGGDPDDGSRAA